MMDISFIYINDYKNIQKQSFNLDAEYFFSFQPETSTVTYVRNENFIPGYFKGKESDERKSIKNITAIVGQNGTGKSTFLEFIGRAFRGWHNFHPAFSFVKDLMVLRIENVVVILYGQNQSVHEIKDNSGLVKHTPFSLDSISNEHHNFPKTSQNNQILKQSILPIYYSSSMIDRFHETGVDEWDVSNISNAYMYYATSLPVQNDPVRETRYRRLKHPGNFKLEDSLRQIVFLNENEKKKFLPKRFKVVEHFSLSIRQQHSHENTFKEIFALTYNKFKPQTDLEFLRLQFLIAMSHGLVFTENKHTPPNTKQSYLDEFKNVIAENDNLKIAILSFLKNHPLRDSKEMAEMFGKYFAMYDFRVREKEVLVEFLFESFTENNFTEVNGEALRNFITNHGNELIEEGHIFFNPYSYNFKFEKGKDLCELYLNQLDDLTPDFIEIHFDLSAGETAFINLFSRFYAGFMAQKSKKAADSDTMIDKYAGVLVIIDEAEVYFHPQWQKEYLNLLKIYFENLFEGRPIQIIIASNSPFVTADLPSYNVMFLEPNDEGKCFVSSIENHKKTLGANIYQLFQDAFYLQNGFMGDLASNKIHEVLELLNYSKSEFKEVSEEKRYFIKQLIENIGEPGLKNRLKEMLEEIVSEND